MTGAATPERRRSLPGRLAVAPSALLLALLAAELVLRSRPLRVTPLLALWMRELFERNGLPRPGGP